MLIAISNSDLLKAKCCFFIGRAANQFEAPFSAAISRHRFTCGEIWVLMPSSSLASIVSILFDGVYFILVVMSGGMLPL